MQSNLYLSLRLFPASKCTCVALAHYMQLKYVDPKYNKIYIVSNLVGKKKLRLNYKRNTNQVLRALIKKANIVISY